MTGPLLPVLAAAAVPGAVLVARPRAAAVHVASPGRRGLTPDGRLRRGVRPVCGQRGRAWPTVQVDGRRLCGRCAAHLRRTVDLAAAARQVPLELLEQTLRCVLDDEQLVAARWLVLNSDHLGAVYRLSRQVAEARGRLTYARRLAKQRAEYAALLGQAGAA